MTAQKAGVYIDEKKMLEDMRQRNVLLQAGT